MKKEHENNHDEIIKTLEKLAFSIPRKRVFQAIQFEREYQEKKIKICGWQENKSLPEYLLIIEGELNEAKKGWIKGGTGRDSIPHEILQIAAVCVAALETLDKVTMNELSYLSATSDPAKSFGSIEQQQESLNK